LANKKKQLFLNRLEKIAGRSLSENGVSNMEIYLDGKKENWNIQYTHTTNNYSLLLYAADGDSDNEVEHKGVPKTTTISFGKSGKYFIKGGSKSSY
jgi:hypothetical protein